MNATKSPNEKAFNFVKISEYPPKPRHDGIVEIRGPYYSAITITYFKIYWICGEIISTVSSLPAVLKGSYQLEY
jgi:hypothetical protein